MAEKDKTVILGLGARENLERERETETHMQFYPNLSREDDSPMGGASNKEWANFSSII